MSSRIGLAAAIESLRIELEESILAGSDQALKFEVGEIELQLHVEISDETEIGGGIKAWVIEAVAGAKESTTVGHLVKIPLTPKGTGGGRVLTGGSTQGQPK